MGALEDRFKLMQMQKAIQSRNGRKIKLRWSTPAEVRRSLAKVNNMVANGELQARGCNAIFYSANLILKALEMEQAKKERLSEGTTN